MSDDGMDLGGFTDDCESREVERLAEENERLTVERDGLRVEVSRLTAELAQLQSSTVHPVTVPTTPQPDFNRERAAYEYMRSKLIAWGHRDMYALFADGKYWGSWPTWEAATKEGFDQFGPKPFFVQLIGA
jgi:hypothetical protein